MEAATRLILTLVGISYTAEEVDQTTGYFLGGTLQIQYHGTLVVEMVGNIAGIFKTLRLYQYHLQLCCSCNIDYFVLLGRNIAQIRHTSTSRFRVIIVIITVVGTIADEIEIIFLIVEFIVRNADETLELIHYTHTLYFSL